MELLPPRLIPAEVLDSRLHPNMPRRFQAGKVVRLTGGYYVESAIWGELPPWERYELAAAAKALRAPHAVFCGETAALLHGLPLARTPKTLHLAVSSRGHTGLAPDTFDASARGVPPAPRASHHSHPRRRVVVRGAYRLVPMEEAVAELAGKLPMELSLPTLDVAVAQLRGRNGGMERLNAAIDALETKTAKAQARGVLALADPLSESPGESQSRAIMARFGFEKPVLQHVIRDAKGFVARVDFWWPSVGVVGEFDGRGKYLDPALLRDIETWEAVNREKHRHERVLQNVRGVVRWGSEEVKHPERLKTLLLEAGVPWDPRKRSRLR